VSAQATIRPPAVDAGWRHSGRKHLQSRPPLALGVLAVVVICFAAFAVSRMFPPQSYGLADDWRVFSAAATVVHNGASPYDAASLHASEQAINHYAVVQPALDDYADLPIVAWALQPLARLPFWAGYALASILGLAAAGFAMFTLLRRLGWRSAGLWTAMALLSWPALLGVFSGQFDLLLLALLVLGMVLARRRPGLAGAVCMAAAVVKPHILWPLPLLVAATQLPDRRAALRCAAAAATTGTVLVGGAEVLMPGSTAAFMAHLFTFGGGISSAQPDLAGLPGLFEHLPGGSAVGAVMAVAGVLTTVGFAGFWAFSGRAQAVAPEMRVALGVGVGMAIWLAATPYAHPNDDVLLFPLVALLLGVDGRAVRQRQLNLALAGSLLIVAGFVVSPVAGAVVTTALALVLWRRRPGTGQTGIAACSLATVAILPMVWPFHVVGVSLTPIAVLVVAVGGVSLAQRTMRFRAGYSRASAVAG
jgi:hypothetical protein